MGDSIYGRCAVSQKLLNIQEYICDLVILDHKQKLCMFVTFWSSHFSNLNYNWWENQLHLYEYPINQES